MVPTQLRDRRGSFVNEHFSYEDSIYFLQSLIRTIADGIALDVDPNMFREQIGDTIVFIDGGLRRISQMLVENRFLIRRIDYLRDLLRVKSDFEQLVDSLRHERTAFAIHLRRLRPAFDRMYTEQREEDERIEAVLRTVDDEPEEAEDTVTSAEFQFLLNDEADGES
jgi:hypothetical protein